MKKFIAGAMAATVFVLAGPAAAYEATVETEMETKVPKRAGKGEKVKVRFDLGTDTNGQPCTGRVELTVIKLTKSGAPKRTAFVKTKDVEDVEDGNGKFSMKIFQSGKYRVIVKYRRGKTDPCSFSRSADTIRITKG